MRDVGVIWLAPGLTPVTGVKPDVRYGSDVRTAIVDALGMPPSGYAGREPWLRAGSGVGASILNRNGIVLLKLVYNDAGGPTPIP